MAAAGDAAATSSTSASPSIFIGIEAVVVANFDGVFVLIVEFVTKFDSDLIGDCSSIS